MIEVVSTISMWELTKHAGSWLVNLKRAKDSRKKQSVAAIRKVITSSRKTAIYMRQLNLNGKRDIEKEGELAMLWTELGFELEDLGVKKLAERCSIKGKHWENPQESDKKYMQKADVSLERMEKIAKELLAEINS
ncbi:MULTISPECIES: hypothetical protein [Vibrio]|uniref:hypothetical protein n=1 Tax=Vibrio TaxID=662 RepID=UPI003242F7BA|tara:strand:+ start:841 stop:1245 length:405 start_codon:yes stop_codon:yes gene_type:complete